MKIGFSFGRCLASIVRGEVAVEDVLCIVARTHMRDAEGVAMVIDEYLHVPGRLYGLDADACHRKGLELWQTGKILEPRANGTSVMSVPSEYIWMDLYPTEADVQSDSVKEAWNTYRMLIALTEQLPEPNDHVVTHTKLNIEKKDIDPQIVNLLIV